MNIRKTDLWDIAIVGGIMLVVWLCYGALASVANAAPVCSTHVVRQAAPVQYLAPVDWRIGAGLRAEAAATYQLRQSEEYAELLHLRGFREGVELATRTAASPAGAPAECTDCQQPAEPQAFEAPTAAPTPAPTPSSDFAATHPQLAASCSSCHSGASPKGGLDIAQAVTAAQASSDCESILAMANTIATGEMPKGKEMSDAERLQAIVELLNQP